jgi:transcription elongation factor Elf1
MDQAQKDNIIRILQERGANLNCPRCGHSNFSLIDGYFNQPIQPQLNNNLIIGGPAVPSVAVVCTHCGFLTQHAIGVLGLLPPAQNSNENTQETNTNA